MTGLITQRDGGSTSACYRDVDGTRCGHQWYQHYRLAQPTHYPDPDDEHGIKKVIPDDEVLNHAYRRAYQIAIINKAVEEITENAQEKAEEAEVPDDLRDEISKSLDASRERSWDKVLADFAEEALSTDDEK